MNKFDLEKLIRLNPKYENAFENNVWFNRSIMSLMVHEGDVNAKYMLETIYKLSEVIIEIQDNYKELMGGKR